MKQISKHILFLLVFAALLSCEKEVSRSPVETFSATNGKIIINSNPQGAEIFLNGRPTGQYTPDSLVWLEDNSYEVYLKMQNFFDTTLTVDISNGSQNNILIDYWASTRAFGMIEVTSTPEGASLFINDSATGKTAPATLEGLFPGHYTIRGEYPSHRHDEKTVLVRSNTTTYSHLGLIDTTIWVTYNKDNSEIPSDFITALEIDVNGNKWIGTNEGLVFYDDNTFTVYDKSNSLLPSANITDIEIAPDGKVWIATTLGIVSINDGTWRGFFFDNITADIKLISDIKFDQVGNAWLGSTEGLLKYDGNVWTLYHPDNSGISAKFITAISIDNEGNIWVGTNAFGINKFDGNTFTVFNTDNTFLPGNSITEAEFDLNNIGWFGHTQHPNRGEIGGLSRFENDNFNQIMLVRNSFAIKDIYIDSENNKWISTANGLELIKPSGEQFVYTELFVGEYEGVIESKLEINDYNVSRVAPNRDLWFGSNGAGITKLKQRKISN